MAKEKYIIISGERDDGELTEDSLTLAEFSDNEVAEYMEQTWTRGESPDILLPVSVVNAILKHKPVTLKELSEEIEEEEQP
jgi:hypothetical protein